MNVLCVVVFPPSSFFVVEDHVLHTTQGLVNRAYVEELWELALSKIIAALRTHSVRTHATEIQILTLESTTHIYAKLRLSHSCGNALTRSSVSAVIL